MYVVFLKCYICILFKTFIKLFEICIYMFHCEGFRFAWYIYRIKSDNIFYINELKIKYQANKRNFLPLPHYMCMTLQNTIITSKIKTKNTNIFRKNWNLNNIVSNKCKEYIFKLVYPLGLYTNSFLENLSLFMHCTW